MPYSTDRLVKELHLRLATKLKPWQLRQCGWFDFRDLDRPDDCDAAAIAAEAVLYTGIDADGNWTGVTDFLMAVFAFLKEFAGATPTETDARDLKSILDEKPVRGDALREWFDRVYR